MIPSYFEIEILAKRSLRMTRGLKGLMNSRKEYVLKYVWTKFTISAILMLMESDLPRNFSPGCSGPEIDRHCLCRQQKLVTAFDTR